MNPILVEKISDLILHKASISQPMHLRIKPKPKVSARWPKGQDIKLLVCPTTSSGTLIPKRKKVIWVQGRHIRVLVFNAHYSYFDSTKIAIEDTCVLVFATGCLQQDLKMIHGMSGRDLVYDLALLGFLKEI